MKEPIWYGTYMDHISYNSSPLLVSEVNKYERIRNQILLTLIPPKEELAFQWEANLKRIHYSLLFEQLSVEYSHISQALDPHANRKLDELSIGITSYKDVFNEIINQWSITEAHITEDDVRSAAKQYGLKNAHFDSQKLVNGLGFIQLSKESALIQIALSQLLVYRSLPEGLPSIRFSFIPAYMFVFKFGYDLRRLLCLEEIFSLDPEYFESIMQQTIQSTDATGYLEMYTQNLNLYAEKILNSLATRSPLSNVPKSYYTLTTRQRQIISLFEKPGLRLTNREVQKMFKVSQITASRDLTKLSSLGMIIARGKGRSVYYTRV